MYNLIDPSAETKTKKKRKIMIEIPDENENQQDDEYFPLDKYDSKQDQMSQISIKSSGRDWNEKIDKPEPKGSIV